MPEEGNVPNDPADRHDPFFCPAPTCPLMEGRPPTITNIKITKLHRRQIGWVLGAFAVMGLGMVILGFISNGGRLAAIDSSNSADAQYRNNVRSACITDRRSAQTNAQGRELAATIRAIAANNAKNTAQASGDMNGLVIAQAEFNKQLMAARAAIEAEEKAARSLDSDIIDKNPPVGCGPPVTSPR